MLLNMSRKAEEDEENMLVLCPVCVMWDYSVCPPVWDVARIAKYVKENNCSDPYCRRPNQEPSCYQLMQFVVQNPWHLKDGCFVDRSVFVNEKSKQKR